MRVGTRFSAAALLLVCLLLVSASAAPKAKKEEEKQKQMKPHLVQGNSPLHNAARDGDISFLTKILDKVEKIFYRSDLRKADNKKLYNFDIDDPDEYPEHFYKNEAGNTPLHLAVHEQQVEAVRILLNKGADPNTRNQNGHRPIHWAAMHNDTTILQLLIANGADVKKETDDTMKFSVLHFCAQKNNVDACRILLDLGCDPNAMTYKGHTPLISAAEHHQTEVAELLLSRGAKPMVDEEGYSPLDYVKGEKALLRFWEIPYQKRLVEVLREHGDTFKEERDAKKKKGGKKKGEEL
mmetsp:Transcript_50547/g.118979  ORF Transcript_50547/g.118979 Transcript_50547/m.118979 type:complete len:295 (-) Transcript_50547:212-1096(-)